MDICLIRPPIVVPNANPIVQFTPPLGLAYVAGAAREAGFSVMVVDGLGESLDTRYPAGSDCHLYGLSPEEIVERIPRETSIIGISAEFTFEWPTCREIIMKIRSHFPNALLVAGGEHITALPQLSLNETDLDIAVLGEGEDIFIALVRAYLSEDFDVSSLKGIAYKDPNAGVTITDRFPRNRSIDDMSWPAWDLLPINEYLDRGKGCGVHRGRSMPVMASRGCPYQCTFCSSPNMWTTRWIARDPDKLLDELEHYQHTYQIENFDFYDLTAIVKKSWIISFCNKIKERDLKFTWQLPSGTRSEAIDPEVSALLYESGCRNLSYAPESGSGSVLKRIKKQIKPDSMIASINASVNVGLNVKTNIMMGFPGETYHEIWETFGFIVRMAWAGAHDLSIWAFSPYPGSEIFDELTVNGQLQIDSNYYDRLRSYSDTSSTLSFSEHIPDRTLKTLRRAGTALFYLVAWGRRPWRPVKSILNVARGIQESRSELALSSLVRSVRLKTGERVS